MKIYNSPSEESWAEICRRPAQDTSAIEGKVADILASVRNEGDAALRRLALEIDGLSIDAIEVSEDEIAEASAAVSDEVKQAISRAAANIRSFHEAQLPQEIRVETAPGVCCVQRPVPVNRVGLYIPGGTAPLFSTVLMLAIPASIAGCREVILCTPPSRQSGKIAPEVLYAASFCGVRRIFKAGGAQAVAAMAYGTESIPKVDKIFGPGNRWVTTAKQLVSRDSTAIDMPAGPSEVMVVADSIARADFIAADLLSQAEHGSDSQVMLVCDSTGLAEAVNQELERQSAMLSRSGFVEQSLDKSRTVIFGSREEMTAFANAYAPEHLILSVRDPWDMAAGISAAGSVFIGNYTPESAGDYASGTNHTLPTCGWARSFSGVNIDSFMRKMTIQEITREGLIGLAPVITAMADAEGLGAHANAVKVRTNE